MSVCHRRGEGQGGQGGAGVGERVGTGRPGWEYVAAWRGQAHLVRDEKTPSESRRTRVLIRASLARLCAGLGARLALDPLAPGSDRVSVS